ncbi:putative kinase [Lentzea atacamensis]|uniref:Putative kinase n=1 Tax=Lentzea atacamensis TaxID=531938 RepID=A0A316IJK0_9PSEU|nr:putative kinase [Lentzea atacamensis]
MVPRLIHLNGPTGVGKSTIAARYAAAHPRTLNLDADEIARLIGGWQDDFHGTVGLVRPLAITMATHHLATGHDVVMPQLIARHAERERFAEAARSTGAQYLEFVLLAPAGVVTRRFRQRDHHIDHVVEALGGVTAVERSCALLADYVTADSIVIETGGDDADRTYETLIAALSARP